MKLYGFKSILLLLTVFLFPFFGINQTSASDSKKIDSLKIVIDEADHDSTIIKSWIAWDNIIYFSDPQQDSLLLSNIVNKCRVNLKSKLKTQEKKFFTKELAKGLNYFGSSLTDLGHYEIAIKKFKAAIPIYKNLNNDNGLDGCYINLGNAYYADGQIKEAIKAYNKGIKVTDKTENYRYRANALMALGNIYLNLEENTKALKYLNISKQIAIEIKAERNLPTVNLNLGNAHLQNNNLDSALYCYQESLLYCKMFDDLYVMGTTYNNLGEVFLKLNQMDSSFYYYNEGMKLRTTQNLQSDLIYSYSGLSSWYLAQDNSKKAVNWGEKALAQAKKFKSNVHVVPAASSLYKAYELDGQHQKSLETYIYLRNAQDSLQSKANQKEILQQEIQYQYEKEKIVDSLAFAKQKAMDDLVMRKDKEKEAQEKFILYGIILFTLLLIVLALFAYFRKKKDNKTIKEQKNKVDIAYGELEEKNQEILDSISYAKRIQSAILPPNKQIEHLLPKSFILYKPKDIVAGDFYWLEQSDDTILFAAADCTGHGVPGAMVSVICNNGLNRSVREHRLKDPGQILDQTRSIVIQEFEKSEDEVKDGMDIALCSIQDNTLKYAGAHNPLWLVRDEELTEIKANKQPIGKFDPQAPFNTHSLELKKDDCIYVFSDGYADQFGGDKGKKFKAKTLKKLILSIQNKSMNEQKTILDETFENWKGSLEQLDDVCIIGVKF